MFEGRDNWLISIANKFLLYLISSKGLDLGWRPFHMDHGPINKARPIQNSFIVIFSHNLAFHVEDLKACSKSKHFQPNFSTPIVSSSPSPSSRLYSAVASQSCQPPPLSVWALTTEASTATKPSAASWSASPTSSLKLTSSAPATPRCVLFRKIFIACCCFGVVVSACVGNLFDEMPVLGSWNSGRCAGCGRGLRPRQRPLWSSPEGLWRDFWSWV